MAKKKKISEMTEMPFSELNMQHVTSHDARVTAFCNSLTYYFKMYTSLYSALSNLYGHLSYLKMNFTALDLYLL